jgi:hypothetical protein
MRETARFEEGRPASQKLLRAVVLAAHGMLLLAAVGGERAAMASHNKEGAAVTVTLPHNWSNLEQVEKFAVLRKSAHLVRGRILPKVQIDCRKQTIKDLSSNAELSTRYPGREGGSFVFAAGEGASIMGGLDYLSSDASRIFVLSRPTTSKGGRGVSRVISNSELSHMASLLGTYHNHCSPAQLGRHIDVLAILAR